MWAACLHPNTKDICEHSCRVGSMGWAEPNDMGENGAKRCSHDCLAMDIPDWNKATEPVHLPFTTWAPLTSWEAEHIIFKSKNRYYRNVFPERKTYSATNGKVKWRHQKDITEVCWSPSLGRQSNKGDRLGFRSSFHTDTLRLHFWQSFGSREQHWDFRYLDPHHPLSCPVGLLSWDLITVGHQPSQGTKVICITQGRYVKPEKFKSAKNLDTALKIIESLLINLLEKIYLYISVWT